MTALVEWTASFAAVSLWHGSLVSAAVYLLRRRQPVERFVHRVAFARCSLVLFALGVLIGTWFVGQSNAGGVVRSDSIGVRWVAESGFALLEPLATRAAGGFLVTALVLLWSVGAMLGLTRVVYGLRRLNRLRKDSRVVSLAELHPELDTRCLSRLGVDRAVAILVDSGVAPFTFGSRAPVIAVPEDYDRAFTSRELEALLLHELSHIRRRDFGVLLGLSVGRAIFWFNPFVWYLVATYEEACEFRCDNDAAEWLGDPAAVARALGTLSAAGSIAAAGLSSFGARSSLVSRVRALLVHGENDERAESVVALFAYASVVLWVVAFGCYSVQQLNRGVWLEHNRSLYLSGAGTFELDRLIGEVSDELRRDGIYDDPLYGDYGIPVFLELDRHEIRMNGHRLPQRSEQAVAAVTSRHGVKRGAGVVFNYYEAEAEIGHRSDDQLRGERVGPREMLDKSYVFVGYEGDCSSGAVETAQ